LALFYFYQNYGRMITVFKRRVEVDLVSLAVIAISHAIMMYGLVEIAYAAGKSVGKIELQSELFQEAIAESILDAESEEKS